MPFPPVRWLRAMVLACALLTAARAAAVISISAGPGGNGVIINTLLGADRFYNNGYFGQNAVAANVEGGAIWNGHETLTQVTTFISDPAIKGTQLGEYDFHATAVGMTIGGLGQGFYYQVGIAPLVNLWSGSIATQFHDDGSFEITNQSFLYAYTQAMQVGRDVTVDLGGGFSFTTHRIADVVNSSYGFTDPTGSAFETMALDALVATNHTTFVAAAGNSGPGGNKVGGPASGYNKISAGALAADTTDNPYTHVASFSSRGPLDFYNPKTNTTVPLVRPGVDISAPGEELALAYYGGTTGGNTGGIDQSNGANNFYWTNAAGTSFAAPTVAGGAALLADYAHVNFGPHGWDARVIKAVLLNSADKTPGWSNHSYRLFNGALATSQGLDYDVGAGRMNLSRAYDQFTTGTTDNVTLTGGHVQATGWAYGRTSSDQPSDYIIDPLFTAGDHLTATLDWFIHRTLIPALNPDDATTTDDRFDNLFLQVWLMRNGLPATEIAESRAIYNNVQHLSFDVPQDGQYLLRVLWAGQQYDFTTPTGGPITEDFALAWSNAAVPEPGAGLMLMVLMISIARRPLRGRTGESLAF